MTERKMKTFKLREPINDGNNNMINEIKIPERLKGKEIRAMDKGDGNVESMFYLIEQASGIPFASIEEMDGQDLTEIQDFVNHFLSRKSPPTGDRLSAE